MPLATIRPVLRTGWRLRLLAAAVTLAAALLSAAPRPALAQEVDEKAEGEGRVRRALEHHRRLQELYGTTDLSELYRRSVVTGLKEVAREREQLRSVPRRTQAAAPAFTSLGPTYRPSIAGNSGVPNGSDDSGLVTNIAPHPTDPKTLLVATAGGGVWKSTDGGGTWKLATGDVGPLQIGAVAYSPSDPSRAYAGTGAGDASSYVLGPGWTPHYPLRVGVGLLISTDGGESWRPSKTAPSEAGGPHGLFWQVLVDPKEPSVLLTAGDKGIQRSTDGGDTFATVLSTEGAPWATDLVRSPAAPDTVYASTWGNKVAGGVHRSTDGGLTWADRSAGLPGTGKTRSRVDLAVAPSDPSRLYALVSGYGEQLDMARSTDGGGTWQALGLESMEPAVDIVRTQGDFATVVAVDPKRPDTVYAGGYDAWKSTDAGATWTRISDWLGGERKPPYLHADHHAIVFGADGTIYFGNDGGIFSSSSGGASFQSLNRGIVSIMVSDLCQDPTRPERIAFGAQDNGSMLRTSGTDWRMTITGDGYGCVLHPTEVNVIVATAQRESFWKTWDGKEFSPSVDGLTEARSAKGVFGTVVVPHPTDPGTFFTFTLRNVWKTTDYADSWSAIGNSLPVTNAIVDLAISPVDPRTLVLVDYKGLVFRTTDGGTIWKKVGSVGSGSNYSKIRIDRKGRLYVATRAPQKEKERLFTSADGENWAAISRSGLSDGLPDLPINALEVDPASENVLWVGSFTGLYRSGNAGATWQRFGTGLPNVPVTAIKPFPDGSRLRVGTFGRGVWEALGTDPGGTLPSPGGTGEPPLAAAFTFEPASPAPGERVSFQEASAGIASGWTWSFADGGASTRQAPDHVFSAEGSFEVALTVKDASGATSTARRTVTVARPRTGTGDALTYLLPVVLSAEGAGGTSYSTELTMANRSGKTLSLTFRLASPSEMSGTYSLAAGQQVWPDVMAFLRERAGLPIPQGTVVSSLRIEVRGAAHLGEFAAGARVTTPPNASLRAQGVKGRFGLSFPATPLLQGAVREAVVYGLQQTSRPGEPGTRSNLACVAAGGGDGKGVTLEATYVDGATGTASPSMDLFALGPFEFQQKAEPLAARRMTGAHAVIRRTGGTDQFVCYGVLNDNVNGDGSFVSMVRNDAPSRTSNAMVPVVVGTDVFRSEMTFTNRTNGTILAWLAVVPSGSADPVYAELELLKGRQVTVPDLLDDLARAGLPLPPGTVASVYVAYEEATDPEGPAEEPREVLTNEAFTGVRTYATSLGGRFGLAYDAVPLGTAVDLEAWVYGLQQSGRQGEEGGTRSNLAVVHAFGGDEADLQLEVTYFGPDGAELGKEPACSPCTLFPGQWRQFGAPLARFGASHGFARIRRVAGTDQFIAYGVLNDQANNDGSYLAMSRP